MKRILTANGGMIALTISRKNTVEHREAWMQWMRAHYRKGRLIAWRYDYNREHFHPTIFPLLDENL